MAKKKATSKAKAKPIKVDLDSQTAILMGSLAQKGIIKLKHDGRLGYNQARLEMTDDPKDKQVTMRANLKMAHAYGFPIGNEG